MIKETMKTRVLGNDLKVSAVGLGCMEFSHAYGTPVESSETIEMIRRAYDIGYTFFDTAEVYGTAKDPHINEQLVGEALKPMRSHVQIASKFGISLPCVGEIGGWFGCFLPYGKRIFKR